MAARRYNNPLNGTQNVSKNSKCNMCLVYKRFKPSNGKSCSYNVRKYRHKACSQSRKTVIHASWKRQNRDVCSFHCHFASFVSILLSFSGICHLSFPFFISSLIFCFYLPRYTPVNSTSHVQITCHENVVLFSLSSFQYILLAVVFSQGAPYRVPVYRNSVYTVLLIIIYIWQYFTLVGVNSLDIYRTSETQGK